MAKTKTKKIWKGITFWLGIGIVTITHIAILAMGLPQDQLGGHAFLNLFAAALIVFANFIK